MKIITYKTQRVNIGDSIFNILDKACLRLKEKSVVAITSKIVSLCEKSVVAKNSPHTFSKKFKAQLIQQEADGLLKAKSHIPGIVLTIKNGLLIPSAGIDESNGDNVFILYPKHIQKTVTKIWRYLRKKHHLNALGILMTDSHTTPLRRGTTGIGLGYCGFEPLYNYIGKPDLYGKPLQVTQTNLLDGLSAAAVLAMGEGAEQTPLVVMTDIPRLNFQNRPPTQKELKSVSIDLEQDIYAPLLQKNRWIWNNSQK